jgi:hypothetical protein
MAGCMSRDIMLRAVDEPGKKGAGFAGPLGVDRNG